MPQKGGGYLVFGSSGGAVELQTQDLATFNFVKSVMTAPVAFNSCNPNTNPADNTEFDENYVGPGTVVQDPTLPAGNLIMIYEAENHCPSGQNQFEYYATSGLARSSDNGNTWPPAPINAPLGGPNRYPALKSATPEPTSPNNMNNGDAIPTAFVDGLYLYILYENATPPENGIILRIARANLKTDNVGGTLQFHKWYNGSFTQPGIGGLDTPLLPSTVCSNGRQGSLAYDDDLGLYIMIFLCIDGKNSQASWYYSTTKSLDTEAWTPPQQIMGSSNPWLSPCTGRSIGQGTDFDGFYPSIMSRGLPVGHIRNTGRIYFLGGCDGGTSDRHFRYRDFTIAGAEPSPVASPPPPVGSPPPPSVPVSGTTFIQVGTLPIPGLTSFDISWVDYTFNGGQYFLADRSNKAIDSWNIPNSGPLKQFGASFVGAFVGPTGAVNNDLSGPNGVLTFANSASGATEIWAGDGPQQNLGCPSFLSGKCSTVKVINANGGALMHVIPTGGAARADELCHDPDHHLILIANDAEADFSFGTPFITFISTDTYKIVAGMQIAQTTNGIEQCQYDHVTGLFFLNLPEVGGPGNDTADGQVLAISPPTSTTAAIVVAVYNIATTNCAGPQGMALGPEPQLMLACNAVGPNGVRNSLIINKHNGSPIAIGWGIGGADEAWSNDTHYFLTGSSCAAGSAACLSGGPQFAIVDHTPNLNQVISITPIGGVSSHSIAADNTTSPGSGKAFLPVAGGVEIFNSSALDGDEGPVLADTPQ